MNEPGQKICEIFRYPRKWLKIWEKLHETFSESKFRFILVKNHGKLAKNRFFDARNRHFRPFLTIKNRFLAKFS